MTLSSINSSMFIAADSMATHSVGIQVASHNIANVSTDNFIPQRATYATGSNGTGVALENVRKLETPFVNKDTLSLSPEAQEYAHVLPESGTDVAREFVGLITNQRGFEANAATVRATDEMLGSLLNMVG